MYGFVKLKSNMMLSLYKWMEKLNNKIALSRSSLYLFWEKICNSLAWAQEIELEEVNSH